MNEKVTKRWVDSLNSTLFTLNVKKNLALCFFKLKNKSNHENTKGRKYEIKIQRKNTKFCKYKLFSVFSVKISGRNKDSFRFWLVVIKTDVATRREKRRVVLKKNPGGYFFRTY